MTIPLEEARARVRAATVFERGEDQVVDGRHVTSADLLWEALLSLADAAELVAEASRLRWEFHPRGFDNRELHERYGDGIVPWLALRLDADGVLHNQPWCVVPCLLACGSPEAFAVAWRTRAIEGRTPWGGAGDGDLAMAWCRAHPDVARAELARLDEPRAWAYRCALGERPAGAATAAEILALLDACAQGLFPTRVRLAPPATSAVRVVAAREGDAWGLAFEWVDGTRPSGLFAARVATLAFGSRVRGVVDGVAVTSRPVPALAAADLDDRLGPPALALPALGLGPAATVVASIPHVAAAPVPSESPVLRALAAAISSA